jgi:hypothetical protein
MSRPLSIRHVLAVVAVAAALATGGAVVSAARATGEAQVVPGLGVWLAGHTDFVGSYRAEVAGRWITMYCVSPHKRAPRHLTLHELRRLPGTSARTSALMAATLAAHGDAHTAAQAEAVSQALNEEFGNREAIALRARQLSARVRRLTARFVAEAERQRGPYALALDLPGRALPGQTAVGSITLRSAAGGVDARATLQHSRNVELPAAVHTGAAGQRHFSYRVVGGGPVHIGATVRALPSQLRSSKTDGATQTMVSWSRRVTLHVTRSYAAPGPEFTHHYACTTQCDGRPDIALSACAPPSTFASRLTYSFGGQSQRADFPAADERSCRTIHLHLGDGVSVRARWQYRAAAGWTRPRTAGGAFTVDCPAAPPVAVLLTYDCTAAQLTATLGTEHAGALVPLRNGSHHPMVLVLGGAAEGRYPVAPDGTATLHTVALECGVDASVTLRGGVQRASGGYNYGAPVTVTVP